jgi:hypothetical protein
MPIHLPAPALDSTDRGKAPAVAWSDAQENAIISQHLRAMATDLIAERSTLRANFVRLVSEGPSTRGG